jgi:hypothetical protein
VVLTPARTPTGSFVDGGIVTNHTAAARDRAGKLAAVNQKAAKGPLSNGDAPLQAQCADLFGSLDQAGGIG